MSRIRTIKPEFWTNAQVVECSTNARLLFVGLWNFCDDFGRHAFSAKQIKGEIFPSDNFTLEDVQGMLRELSENGLIVVYVAENKEILQVTGWHHQRIDKRQKAKYPGQFEDNSMNDPGAFPPDTIRREGKGKEDSSLRSESKNKNLSVFTKKTKSEKISIEKRGKTEIAMDAKLGLADSNFAGEAGMDLDRTIGEWTKFRDHHRKNGTLFADWHAAWRSWVRKAIEIKPNGHDPPKGPTRPAQFFIEVDTPQWNAWTEFSRKSGGVGYPQRTHSETRKRGWDFPAEYPPPIET
jgi:hypothetical protein